MKFLIIRKVAYGEILCLTPLNKQQRELKAIRAIFDLDDGR